MTENLEPKANRFKKYLSWGQNDSHPFASTDSSNLQGHSNGHSLVLPLLNG